MRLKNDLKVGYIAAFLLTFAGIVSAGASLTPTHLQCEFRTNPLGIDVVRPHLNWQVESSERNQKQTAYQILVASSEALLRNNQGDLWDSGRISTDETVGIVYAGEALVSGRQCFWKVKSWDINGAASAWSSPAEWSMGLLEPGDWQGKWIGWDHGEMKYDFGGSKWIWFPEGNPAEQAPVATRYFRRAFELPTNQAVSSAMIDITADDQFRLFVNGAEAAKGDYWKAPGKISIGSLLKPGKNVLAVEARNVGANPNAAGFICKLKVELEPGRSVSLNTDDTWKSAGQREEGWTAIDFNDSAWASAKSIGEYGMEPWGKIEDANRRLPARYLRREFTTAKKVRRATAYVCGLGLFELYLNGHKASDDVLSPALSEYVKRAFYRTYDVTAQLRRGENAIGATLGNGRFFSPRQGAQSYGYPKLLLQLNIEYADGTRSQVVSDENWKITSDGPIRANNEYDGEEYDARMEMPGWNQINFNDSKWHPAELVEPGSPILSAQIGEPIRVTDTLHPIAMTNPKAGVYVFDLGQNIAGWCRLKVSGPKGTQVKLRHAEILKPDGTIYTDNLRTARAEDIFTLKGSGVETYEPRFTYHGFRYVEVTGFPGKPTLEAIDGRVVHDALPEIGGFETSNQLLNKIHNNIYWTTRDNYRSMPTDLPRDERQGWMGDRQEVSKGETYLFNVAPLYAQWLVDMQDEQRADGSVPDVCPAYWSLYQDGVVWASSYLIIPHMLYDQYGDVGVLEKHYASMKKWADYMASFLKEDIMERNTYADWCFPPKSPAEMTVINSADPKLTTSGSLISTAIFYHDLCLMGRSARLLGKADDAKRFETLAARIKAAFNHRFYKSALGYYDNGTQTSCALPLAFGMVPDGNKAQVFSHLVEKITIESDNHLGTGLVGGHYLMRVLSDNGRPDLAVAVATQTTYPSWGYMVSKGATTMWELWNGDTADAGMNSRNIVMLTGDLNIWLHEYVGGIRPDADSPGFKKIIIKPEIAGELTFVRVGYDSIRGRISSEWRRSNKRFDLRVSIPANATATVFLPASNPKTVTESGHPASQSAGVTFLRYESGAALYQIGSGNYHFDCEMDPN